MRTMMMIAAGCMLAAGCSTVPPPIDTPQGGTVTCVRVAMLTTSTTTVYVTADRPGTIVVQPDCTVAATIE